MTNYSAAVLKAPGLANVFTVLNELREATAAAVAERAGLAYSTTTPKLRKLEDAGLAEPFRADDRRTLWRLTPTGHTIGAAPATSDAAPTATDTDTDTDQAATATRSDEAIAEQDQSADDKPDPQPQQLSDTPSTTEQTETDTNHEPRPDPVTAADHQATRPANPIASTSTPTGGQPPESAEVATPTADGGGADPAAAEPSRPQRRPKGALRGAIVDVLENHPDRQYKVGELCKLINDAERGTRLPQASPGAVANALDKLIIAGIAVQTVAAPVTVQLAPPSPSKD